LVRFEALDYVVLGAALAGFLGLGFSARLRERTNLQLIAAGRKLTLPLFVATLVTTWYGGILGIGESFSSYGLATYTILAVPYYVFGAAFALFMAGRVRVEDQISVPERLSRCYGTLAGVIGALLILLLAAPSAHVFMLGTLLESALGWHFLPSLAVGATVGTLFLYRGGLLADARSNLLSFAMMYVAFGVLLIASMAKFGSPFEAISALPNHLRGWSGSGVLFALSWFVLGAWTFVDPGFHQRVAAAMSPQVARRGVLISVGFWMLFDLLSIGAALYGVAALGSGHGAKLFPVFGDALLGPGVKGLFFAGMFGVVTSAMVGYTLVCGSTIGRDLAGKVLRLSESQAVLWTRIGIAAATAIGILLAVAIPSVVYLWYDLGGIAIPGLLYPTVFAYATRTPISRQTAIACLTVGSGTALGWYAIGKAGSLPESAANVPHLVTGLIAATLALAVGLALERRHSDERRSIS
jgi:SSS family solute:Na+ symporter